MTTFHLMRQRKFKEIVKKQSRYEDVLVFDEYLPQQETRSIDGSTGDVQRMFVVETPLVYVDFVPTYKFDATTQKLKLIEYGGIVDKANRWLNSRTKIRILACETLYVKYELQFAESGDIGRKKIVEVSKWPIQSQDTCLDFFNLNQTIHVHVLFCGKYIVHGLRIWIVPDTEQTVPVKVGYKEYIPRLSDDIQLDGTKKMRSKCWEKMEQITERINCDLALRQAPGKLINISSFSCFDEDISLDQLVNVVRVWFDISKQPEIDILIGFADFIPEYISGGGFIQHPVFETQTQLVKKASDWLECNSEVEFLGCNTIDIKLRSLTSIDTSEMVFPRNTGDFIRILRICYRKVESISPVDLPPAAPIYLRAKFLVSRDNSERQLYSQMLELTSGQQWNENSNVAHRWKPLFAETMPHFIASRGSKAAELESVLEQSFHAISISSSAMNRKLLTGIHIYYDVGYFEHQSQQQRDRMLTSESAKRIPASLSDGDSGTQRRCVIL